MVDGESGRGGGLTDQRQGERDRNLHGESFHVYIEIRYLSRRINMIVLSLSLIFICRGVSSLRIKAIDNDKKGHQYSYTRYPSRQIYGKDYEAQLEV